MTSGIKGKQGFPQTIKPEDIKSVLTDQPMKNSTVLTELIKLNKRKYKKVSLGGVKKVLLKLGKEEKISGGYNEELRVYLWKKKE